MDQQAFIEQLKPVLQNPDFDSLFEEITQDLSRSDRFLLKMEVTRINQLSRQSIDLRGKVIGHCEQVEVAGVTHFLTRPLALQLEQIIKLYGDRHTVGAVEELLANVRKPEAITPTVNDGDKALEPGELELTALGHYAMRREVRRTFSTPITAWQNPNEKHSGITLDLSLGGAKVRLPAEMHLSENHPLQLHFTELSAEFVSPALDAGLSYQIIEVEEKKGYQYARLQRLESTEQQEQELERILQASSLRTVPEITHLCATIRSHGYERHLLPCLDTITIAYGIQQDSLQPLIVMQCQGNQQALNYWCNERGTNQLIGILSPERIARALKHPDQLSHSLLFSFSLNQNNQTLFFSATLAELQSAKMVDGFLQFASTQASLRLHQLTVNNVNQFDIQRAQINPINNQRFEPLVQQQMNGVSLVVTLQPMPINAEPLSHRKGAEDPNQLRQFGAKRLAQSGIKTLASTHQDMRSEPRYNFNTVVQLSQGRGNRVDGQTQNISAHGMLVKLNQPHGFAIDQTIMVELPQLQQLAGKIKLADIPYIAVGNSADPTVLRLQATEHNHLGRRFLADMLDKNSDRLGKNSSSKQHKQLAEGIKHLALPRLAKLPMFIHRKKEKLVADMLTCSNVKLPLLSRLHPSGGAPVKLDWLLQHPQVAAALAELEGMQPLEQRSLTLAIALPRDGLKAQILDCNAMAPEILRQFIIKAIAQKRLLGLQFDLYHCDKPDLDYLQHDLAALGGNAQHRARSLETELWQVRGVAMMLDISPALLCQHGLESLLPTLADQY